MDVATQGGDLAWDWAGETMSRHRFDVATWSSLNWCCDLVLASRHGAGCLCRSLFGHCSGHCLDTVHGHCA